MKSYIYLHTYDLISGSRHAGEKDMRIQYLPHRAIKRVLRSFFVCRMQNGTEDNVVLPNLDLTTSARYYAGTRDPY